MPIHRRNLQFHESSWLKTVSLLIISLPEKAVEYPGLFSQYWRPGETYCSVLAVIEPAQELRRVLWTIPAFKVPNRYETCEGERCRGASAETRDKRMLQSSI